MTGVSRYALSPEARVRPEAFGLLFYHTGTTNLTFVRSGALLEVSPESGCIRAAKASLGAEEEEKIRRVLRMLLAKGLIVDAGAAGERATPARVVVMRGTGT